MSTINIKSEVHESYHFEDNFEEKTKAAHGKLREHLKVPFEEQNESWNTKLYDLVPQCWYEVRGEITDPMDHPHVAVMLVKDEQIDQIGQSKETPSCVIRVSNKTNIIPFSELALKAMSNCMGIAIVSSEESKRPDAMLRFGSVWSYLEFKHLGGCGNCIADFEKAYAINPENPYEVIVNDTDEITVSKPSEEFFPIYIRKIIEALFQDAMPHAQVNFILISQKKYAMSLSILISTGLELNQDYKRKLESYLIWFMPPYLALCIK